MREVNFLGYKLINTLASWHDKRFTNFIHALLPKHLLRLSWIKPFVWRHLIRRPRPQALFGIHFLLGVLSEGRAGLLIHLKRRYAAKRIITVTLKTVPELRLGLITQNIWIFRQVYFRLRLILQQLPLLIKCEQIAEEICVGAIRIRKRNR